MAQQVVDAGAGPAGEVRPGAGAGAAPVEQVLTDPSFREGAARVAASFAAAGGAPRAADHLEKLLP